ncbi:MAG: hypothetical protein ACR2JD_03370 [Nocardioides sp.]
MIAIVTVLLAFPLGFALSRTAANTAYAVGYLWAFVFQTLYLLLDSLGGGTDPAFLPGEFPWSYGLVALAIFLAGFGLVALGQRVGAQRRSRRPALASA